MRCPGCGLSGLKDEACTHMTCDKCQTVWCYFCGLDQVHADKEGGADNIYQHNRKWYSTEGRCPMYLTEISQVDDRWPEEDEECLEFFHRKRAIRLLRDFVNEIKVDNYKKLVEIFPQCGEGAGFSLEDILTEDIELIKRNADYMSDQE